MSPPRRCTNCPCSTTTTILTSHANTAFPSPSDTTIMVLNDIAKPSYNITAATKCHRASAAILHHLKKTWTHITTDLFVCTKRTKMTGQTGSRDNTTAGTIKSPHSRIQATQVIRHANRPLHRVGEEVVHHHRPCLSAPGRRPSHHTRPPRPTRALHCQSRPCGHFSHRTPRMDFKRHDPHAHLGERGRSQGHYPPPGEPPGGGLLLHG